MIIHTNACTFVSNIEWHLPHVILCCFYTPLFHTIFIHNLFICTTVLFISFLFKIKMYGFQENTFKSNIQKIFPLIVFPDSKVMIYFYIRWVQVQ